MGKLIMNESLEYISFDFVRKLITAERYKDYKKEEWGGCDLVIVSNQRYKDRKDSYDKWEKQIDHKVYELYGLTPEEVAIVEGK